MKLLFDHNLSPRLVKQLSDIFPGSDHVFILGMDRMSDHQIRAFAAAEGFAIVTKDADYGELHSLLGGPPKVIWIRSGNCSTAAVERIIRGHENELTQFDKNPDAGVLALF